MYATEPSVTMAAAWSVHPARPATSCLLVPSPHAHYCLLACASRRTTAAHGSRAGRHSCSPPARCAAGAAGRASLMAPSPAARASHPGPGRRRRQDRPGPRPTAIVLPVGVRWKVEDEMLR
uniref:Uncharacterized protein n=1 Tax=Setaria viridis TaxID=4556 RepID=A0A4U6VW50_SETVI|nr:hypothetical protein SEVIR_2G220000v2 [Setaria viridis]